MRPARKEPEESAAREPLEWLDEARERGDRYDLSTRMESLCALRRWIAARPDLEKAGADSRELVVLAVYEACANIIEHGYGLEPSGAFTVWWVPAEDPEPGAEKENIWGHFLILDQGLPFSGSSWKTSNLENREERLRGRGLGMDIIRSVMTPVEHRPETPEGNITRLGFSFADPARRERTHPHGR